MFVCFLYQLEQEQSILGEMEATLNRKMAEHEELETQIQTEHDEEVKALYQQKQQLARQLEEAKMSYYQSIDEQDQRVRIRCLELCHNTC